MVRYQDSFIAETINLIDGNAPFETTVRAVTPGGTVRQNHTNVFKQIIALFKREARANYIRLAGNVRGYRPSLVRGFVVVTMPETGNSYFVNGSVALTELTPDMLSEVVGKMAQSNAVVLLTELEFSFKFFPAAIGGGGEKLRAPTWLKNQIKFANSWKNNGVNCAAFAICDVLYKRSHHYVRNAARQIYDAKLLCEKLDWGDYIHHGQLKDFVDHADYCTWRITIHTCESRTRKYLADFKGNRWTDQNKTISLIYDVVQRHFGLGTVTNSLGKDFKECHDCGKVYNCMYYERCDCSDSLPARPKIKKFSDCEMCGKSISSGKICSQCKGVTCATCKENYSAGTFHRCIVYKAIKDDEEKIWIPGMAQDGSFPAVWSYDFESFIKYNKTVQMMVVGFKYDENGQLIDSQDVDEVCVYDRIQGEHCVDFVCLKNIFDDSLNMTFAGETCILDMVLYLLNFNAGNNICFAHNASGYDGRLLFSACKNLNVQTNIKPVMRGGKFIEIMIEGRQIDDRRKKTKLVFRDSLLHLRGSLASLAKDFCGGVLMKGHFPHLFNRNEVKNYTGQIPDFECFDLSMYCKSKKDYDDAKLWHSTWHDVNGPVYDLEKELKLYCQNDVDVHAMCMRGYYDVLWKKYEMTVFLYATAPSFVHNMFVKKLGHELELHNIEDPGERLDRIETLARTKYWAVLKANEYAFARSALRGGRTDVRKLYHKVSDEEFARGVKIGYWDICSEYPYQQVVHKFPVGLPDIHVWDEAFYPCAGIHQFVINYKCNCQDKNTDRFMTIRRVQSQWSAEYILGLADFFGIVNVTLEPPKDLLHPVLNIYDEESNKSLPTLDTIVETSFTSVELLVALKNGYKLIRIHRYDKYTAKDSLWRDYIFDLYLEKMVNSKNEPEFEDLIFLAEKYRGKFGSEVDPEFGDYVYDKILSTRGTWGKNPAKKLTFKIAMNSGWGKHAQKPIPQQSEILCWRNQMDQVLDLYSNFEKGMYEFNDAILYGTDTVMYKYVPNGQNLKPNLKDGYLPAAVFVPAYGRIQLWEQMNKLGRRVLMNDTDSIVFVYDPELYNIPTGDLLGEWEEEDVSKLGIREFVGLGPKTYGLKCDGGYESVKTKGVSLSYATGNIVNFDVMKEKVLDALEKKKPSVTKVPFKTFVYNVKKGMTTWYGLKDLRLNLDDLKGDLDDEGYLLPFGYKE